MPLCAGEVAKGDLAIIGLGLEVDRNPVTTSVDVPANVQTIFGGKTNDEAPAAPGLTALGELTGPGIDSPITLVATPGRAFALPALHEKGEYTLQNIRLVGADGAFLQQASPSFAVIQVADILQTTMRVRQLTPAELRERGISIDSRNYEVYEYTFLFGVEGNTVEIPYPVIIDKRTHQVAGGEGAVLPLPTIENKKPPRFSPPITETFELYSGGPQSGAPDVLRRGGSVPSIPAALVIPNGFGVLHQFFAVVLNVQNAAPEGSSIRLDSVTATINAPLQMRVAKVMPAVTLGQPVPIVDSATGTTFFVAGAQGSAEWTLEALKAGTHTVDIEVNATYQQPGQEDFPLRGHTSASLVVSDPRFQITFSHPDTVRKDERYTAYAFITNLSAQRQHVMLDTSAIPSCTSGSALENICRQEGAAAQTELDLEPGQMTPVPYKLSSKITGKVFAAAGAASDDALAVSVKLTMGVSASGIPLSPATLVMPYYAQFLPSDFVGENMQLLGLGYSLATAPLNKYTAALPRIVKTDVYTRAQEIARAGERVFAGENESDAFMHLALDLLDNHERVDQLAITPELGEWDELRRVEEAGRHSAAAVARELERTHATSTPAQFVDDFAAATVHRSPFAFAYVHGAPATLSVAGITSGAKADVAAENAGDWVRTLPFAEITKLDLGGEEGQLALVGRWKEDLRVSVLPSTTSFTLHLLWPDTNDGAMLRADLDVTNATPGIPVQVELTRGARTLVVHNATATPVVETVPQTPLRILGAAQDLHLDAGGHLVTLVFNRPVTIAEGVKLRDRFALTINVTKANYTATRRNDANDPDAELQIPGAALQDDGRMINVVFDKTLSRNAAYTLAVDSILDRITASSFAANDIVPRVFNDRPGGILTGLVLRADNTPVPNVAVQLSSNGVDQFDIANADGRYMFEFVPRDIDARIYGDYDLRAASPDGKLATVSGSVRLPGEVHNVNLIFFGRGGARGQVRYDDGQPLANVTVTIGSTVFGGYRTGKTDANGFYEIDDLPVAPLTFAVVDPDGRTTYAANYLRTAGEVVTQDLVVIRAQPVGLGKVRVTVRRSDTNAIVAGAHVGVGTQGYGLQEGDTGVDGTITFEGVPAGLVSIITADWSISRETAGVELDLRADETLETTLTIQVPDTSTKYATLEGTITRDDPAAPADTSRDVIVAGAVIKVGNLPTVTAGADGKYVYPDLVVGRVGKGVPISVFDPATGRTSWFDSPDVIEGTNHLSMRMTSLTTARATMRVRLYNAKGEPVIGYRVLSPGYPPEQFTMKAEGVYELGDVLVPQGDAVVAVAGSNSGYGDQMASGRVRVDFNGQIGVTDLRLPGSGTIVARLDVGGSPAIGPVAVTYAAWDDAEQRAMSKTVEFQPDADGVVTITNIPARQEVLVAAVRNPAGYAEERLTLAYDGDVRQVTLHLTTISEISGRVLSYDGITPVAGATVKLDVRFATYSPVLTKPDGSFRFTGIAAKSGYKLTAELTQDGIYRTAFAEGATPDGGGPVTGLVLTMREQSTVEGRVVDANGEAVPLAHYWLKELTWPYREIGTPLDPLVADLGGRFLVSNVFTGSFRITAVAPDNQEERGDYLGKLAEEGDATQRAIEVAIGGAGLGSASVTVLDPVLGFAPVENADVILYRGGSRFDLTSSNDKGVAFFDVLPPGDYEAVAYSKSAGRMGRSAHFAVVSNETASTVVNLEFRGFVSGYVTDPESEPEPNMPVPSLPVTLSAVVKWTGDTMRTRDTTDANGAFEFDGVPEGEFELDAIQEGSERHASAGGLSISRLVPERRDVHLELERTGTLTVKVYLPNDSGGPGELVPLAEVTACQCNRITGQYPYYRGLQGNPVTFKKMLRRMGYELEVKELGGENRIIKVGGGFGTNEYEKEQIVVLPASGSAEVLVLDGSGNPVENAEVNVYSYGGLDRRLYTPENGLITLPNVPFGLFVASAKKDNVSASASGDLRSRSVPLHLTLNLGTSIAAQGFVDAEAEAGTPSVGTRVILTVATSLAPDMRLETLTDANGAYTFTGIPVGNTTLTVQAYGPDDTTIGATASLAVPNGTTGTVTMPRVRLDATPPRVISIDPPANATNVSPTSTITVLFNERVAPQYLSNQYFQLFATDDNAQVAGTITSESLTDGTFAVHFAAPAPPAGQKFPLKSNVLYRFAVANVRDLTGNVMKSVVGSSFTTVNYTEPAIIRVDPAENLPLPAASTFRIKFNKAIDASSATIVFDRLDAYKGNAIEGVPFTRYVDPADPAMLVVAPNGVAIAESSFYRLAISGTRDTQSPPNVQKDARVLEYFSYDTHKPVVAIVSPVAAGESLISGVLYSAGVSVSNEGTNDEAKDVAFVDWLDAAGVSIARVKTKPFAYSFVAPSTTTGTTFTLKAVATDLSGNTSAEIASFTWQVSANAAPRDVVVTATPGSAYPAQNVNARVAFKDEGVAVTVGLELRGTNVDGSELHQIIGSKKITRTGTDVPFDDATFAFDLPATLKDGTATLVATATDSSNNSGTGQTTLTILKDEIAPSIVSFTPAAETRFKYGVTNRYTIELQAADGESGIDHATISVGGVAQSGITTTTGSGFTTFSKSVDVPPKNADTRVPIVVTAYDRRGNSVSDTHEVVYERVDDATVPSAAWITPVDGAALPSNLAGWQTTLRVRATDDVKVTSVRFESSALASPVTVTTPKSGTTDTFETKALLSMPADGSAFTITAIVADGDPAHDVELPISITPIAAAPPIIGDIGISSVNAAQYAGKSIVVKGAKVYVNVPLSLTDLILIDGATISNPEETKLDVVITDHLFVDGDSRIDLTDKGYLGGLRTSELGSTNTSRSGRTLAGDGAIEADASYGGIGGSETGATNATYGSIVEPADFGSGGAAAASGGAWGGNGGGAVLLRGGFFAVAGAIRADSQSTQSGAGSGGSINLRAATLVTGAAARITANGGDRPANVDVDRGGGGGRIAIRVTSRLDLDASLPIVQARGGRNNAEGARYADGGAGTVYLERPDGTRELAISSFDERHPASANRTMATPLVSAVDVDAITIGPRALVRFDVEPFAPFTTDPTAAVVLPNDVPSLANVITTPAAGSQLPQGSALVAHYDAASVAGIREIRTTLDTQPPVFNHPSFATDVTNGTATIAIPNNATPGAVTLRTRVSDRAGRVVESDSIAFTIAANSVPVIGTFTITPPSESYAGRSLAVSAIASDDITVTALTLTSSIGTVTSAAPTQPDPTSLARTFTVSIPPATPSGSDIVLTLSAADGFPGHAATTASQTVKVTKDALAPSVAITQPHENDQFNEGTGNTFVVEATASDAEVAVQRVFATVDGTDTPMTLVSGNLYRATLPVPSVDVLTSKTVTVTALDYEGNTSSSSVTISIKPLVDPNGPSLQWTCSTTGSMYAAGYPMTLRISAIPNVSTNGVDRVEFNVDGGAAIAATSVGTNLWEAKYTIPAGTPDGTQLALRAYAHTIGSNEAVILGTTTVVTGTVVTGAVTLASTDTSFEDRTVIVAPNAVLTISGAHRFARLIVLDAGKVITSNTDALTSAQLFVACGGAIDDTGKGYGSSQTYPGATAPHAWTAGHHIGRACCESGILATYGSVTNPAELGGGPYAAAYPGGGVVRLSVSDLLLEGAIRANGTDTFSTTDGRSGGGGSIRIDAGLIRGKGTIEARAGDAYHEAAAGGAIALTYSDAASVVPSLTARGGVSTRGLHGGAGSIYVVKPGATLGDANIENTTGNAWTDLPSLGNGVALDGTSGATLVTDRTTDIPAYFNDHWVEVRSSNGVRKGIWRVASLGARTITLTPNAGETLDLRKGDLWRGAYRFAALTLKTINISSPDLVEYTTLTKTSANLVMNAGAPDFPAALRSQIVVTSSPNGDYVSAPNGAVTDPDGTIVVTVTNTRTGLTFTGNASNGSFKIAVNGATGDTFNVRARDSHTYPLTSGAIDVNGALTEYNSLAALTIDPSVVAGTSGATGTLRLAYPARSGGVTVLLSSSDANVVVPPSVTFGGAAGAQFPITTTAPASAITATITATFITTRTAELTVMPPGDTLIALSLDSASVDSGASATGTVTLGAPAPAGGAVIALSSSDITRATVPASVTIDAGATTATFTIATTRVAVSSSVTISGTYGATRTATLTLNACSTLGIASSATTTPTKVWFDDDVPSGATTTGTQAFDATQAASGTRALHFAPASGAREWSFSGGTTFSVAPSDTLSIDALINPCNPPRAIVVVWNGTVTGRASWGEDLIDAGQQQRIGPLTANGQWTRFSVLAKSIGITSTTTLSGLTIKVYDGEAWFDLGGSSACLLARAPRPERNANEKVWFDDAAPAGGILWNTTDSIHVPWQWDTTQAAVGDNSHYIIPKSGTHQHVMYDATETMTFSPGDVAFFYVLIDPCNPPRELMLEFNDGSNWDHRAVWGEELISFGNIGTRAYMGPLPKSGGWVRLEVPVSLLRLDTSSVRGVAWTLYDGAAWIDAVGRIPRVNVAASKTARQSTTLNTGTPASRAVDGDLRSTTESDHAITTSQSQPWWEVDLGSVQPIESIQLWNRIDCCSSRLNNFWVFLSDTPITSTTVAGTRATPGVRVFRHADEVGRTMDLRINQRARYVRVQLEGTDLLQLNEVQVWAPASSVMVNLAGGNTATSQASTFQSATSERAVDGYMWGHYYDDQSVAHTNDGTAMPWWQIDLGSVQPISRIDLMNATHCCIDRDTNFYLFVSDTPFTSTSPAATIAQPGVATYYYGTPGRIGYSFDLQRSGRYVRVQLNKTDDLMLTEVQIWSNGTLLAPLAKPAQEEER